MNRKNIVLQRNPSKSSCNFASVIDKRNKCTINNYEQEALKSPINYQEQKPITGAFTKI